MKEPFSMCMDEIAELTDYQIAYVCFIPDDKVDAPSPPDAVPAQDFMTAIRKACEEAGTQPPEIEG